MQKSRLIYIRWGRGVRRYRVKNFGNYVKVGKKGRFNIYAKKKKIKKKKVKTPKFPEKKLRKKSSFSRITQNEKRKTHQRPKKVKTSREEEKFIARIKGQKLEGSEKEIEIEKKLLKSVQLLPKFDKYYYIRKINPKKKVLTNGKTYGSFYDLDNHKRDIYMELIGGLVTAKNDKFGNKLYALRRDLLKDGIVVEVDLYGTLAKNSRRVVYLGTLGIVGLMIEEAGFIESEIVGWSGENRQIEPIFDGRTRNLGGQRCYWIKNNMTMDTEFVYITNVNLRLNYA